MKKTFQYILLFPALLFVLNSCQKSMPVEVFRHAYVLVTYKDFIGSPGVLVLVNKDTVGTVNAGGSVARVLVTDGKPMTLTVKNTTTGAVLLDSVFTPLAQNKFILFISDLIGVAQFYKPPATVPDANTIKMQFLHQVIVNGEEHKKVNFQFFTRDGYSGPFTPTSYELKNVEFGKLSEPIILPLPAANSSGYRPFYYIKTYDAETGAVLLDIWEDYSSGIIMYATGGKSVIVNVKSDDYPPDGAFYNLLDVYEL
jgi:hypothetical protein